MAVEPEAIRRAHEWLKEVYARQPERDAPLHDDLRRAGQASLHGGGPGRERPPSATSATRASIPFTRGVYPSMYRGRLWTMRQFAGLRHRRGDQRALPLPARPRPDRALDRVRHADADGPRLRQPALARRGRPRGRRDRHARRHGDAVRRHPARRGHDVDDDQRAGRDPARVLRVRGRASRASRATGSAARSRPTS